MFFVDSETYLISPGCLAPPLVCVQFARDMGQPVVAVVGVDPVRDVLEALLTSGEFLVGQNIAYDLLVFGRQYPDLMPDIFQAYADGHITDTIVREKLKRIADGTFWRMRNYGWNLGVLAERYGEVKDSDDPWRLRYHELWGVSFLDWPEAARKYALGDVVATRQVYLRQPFSGGKNAEQLKQEALDRYGLGDPGPWRISPDEARQCRAAWMLHIIGSNGVRTDLEQIRKFEVQERDLYEEDKRFLHGSGLVRADGSRNTKAAQARMEEVIKMKGGSVRRTETGLVALDEEACLESNDPLLLAYQRYGSRKNLLTRIQALYRGVDAPLNPSFDSLVETGRTSCRKPSDGSPTYGYQIQNMRRVVGERECFAALPGNVFCSSDYDTLELRTLAQCCLWALGYSELAQVLCAGEDPHLALAAETLSLDYTEAEDIYKDLKHPRQAEVENARQVCKVANFGFPGGMASSTFCAYARGYGIELTEVQAMGLQRRWFQRWCEMTGYFNWIKRRWTWRESRRKDRDVRVTTIRQFASERTRANITYTVAANSFFQGLAADLSKSAGFALVMACELGELRGWKVWNFVHDEYILEGPEHDGDRAARVVKRIMEEEGQKWVPDIPISAGVALMRRWSKKAKPVYRDGKLVPWEDRDAPGN